MGAVIVWGIILSLLHSNLFYGKKLGISVAIFIIAILIYLVGALYKLKKIENDKVLILTIPILLLSFTYFIFSNYMFRFLNIFAIIFLIALMSYLMINKSEKRSAIGIVKKVLKVLFGPSEYIAEPFRYIKIKFKGIENESLTEKKGIQKSIVKGIFVSLPIVIIVLMLLSSADMVFGSIFENILYVFTDNMYSLILRCVCILITFVYFTSYIYNLVEKDSSVQVGTFREKEHKIDNYVILTMITILNMIYLLFSIIQFSYLFTKVGVAKNFDYATYARSGFFQLVFVSAINFVLILVSTMNKQEGTRKVEGYKKTVNTLLCIFNIIILVSSWYRMYLYESTYGYTSLRLLVYFGIFTEAILLIITMFYIFKEKIDIFKYYLCVVVCVYVIMNYINLDKTIAKRNVDRYFEGKEIDYIYLTSDLSDDAISEIVRLLNTKDTDMKIYVENYLLRTYINIEEEDDKWQEFNLSKTNARNLVKSLDIDYIRMEDFL